LDQLLVQRGLAETREKAKAMVMEGLVQVKGFPADKPGRLIPTSASVVTNKVSPPYVSRGGLKLEAALHHFAVTIKGQTLIDIGASTGGFTDCLLKHGAHRVIAVDVGYGQLDWGLRNDHRVKVLERTNIRYLNPCDIEETIDGAVIDVSFISLRLVVPSVSELLRKRAFIIALIKPQFEAGKGQVGKGGVVRDPQLHQQVVDGLCRFFKDFGWTVMGHIPSPLLGPKGNREFLIHLTR
jgi:23S rRNA (cytidine1920-2'-O)/16S rRNA (cytidine1409-2'-O)-methyltransferase